VTAADIRDSVEEVTVTANNIRDLVWKRGL
jgi:hypothetical protein